MLKKILLLLIFFSFFGVVKAQIEVIKYANNSFPKVEEAVKVTISIENNSSKTKYLRVIEFFEGEIIYPKEKIRNITLPKGIIAAIPPHLFWNFSLEPKEKIFLEYIFVPKFVGPLTIQPTQVYDEEGNSYFSNSVRLEVKCNLNGRCEREIGENCLNCQDCSCPSSYECIGGECIFKGSICGNKICEEGENQSNCCLDCGCPFGYRCIKNECVKTGNFLIYFIVIAIIAALLAIIIFKTKKTYEKPS